MRSRFLALLVTTLSVGSCLDPTQVTVTLSTDVDCPVVARDLASVQVASSHVQTGSCTTGAGPHGTNRVGDLVLVPSSSPDNAFVVTAVLGVSRPTDQCDVAQPTGCIVARRAIRYISHTSLRLPIELQVSCLGVACAPNQTCSHGSCVDATIDPNTCSNGDCPSPDGGAPDASVVDASPTPDASPCNADLLTDPKNCGRCAFDCSGGECIGGLCKLLAPNTQPRALAAGACITTLSDTVYVTTGAAAGIGDVLSIPKVGGTFTFVQAGVAGGTFGLATDGTEVYASSPGAVFPTLKNNASIMLKYVYGGALASDGKTVCAAVLGPTAGGVECVPGGLVLSRQISKPVKLAVSGSTVLSTWDDGSAWKSTIGGPMAQLPSVKLGSADGVAIVSSTTSIFAEPTSGDVIRFTEPMSTTTLSNVPKPRGVAYDPQTQEVFVASEGSGPSTGGIVSIGAGPLRQLAGKQDAPNCIAIDATAVYWLNGQIPMKAAR